jgi:hypothetical protein
MGPEVDSYEKTSQTMIVLLYGNDKRSLAVNSLLLYLPLFFLFVKKAI